MATSKDFQIIHKRYQEEGLPHGVSIIRFCKRHGIIYKQYERWLRNRGKVSIHPVSLTNVPAEEVQDKVVVSNFETSNFGKVNSPVLGNKKAFIYFVSTKT